MSHHHHVPLTGAELTEENLTGAPVYGPENERVGRIGELLLAGEEEVRSAVIDVGGFLGIGAKHVLVPFDSLRFVHDGEGGNMHAHISWTKDELKERPEFIGPEETGGFVVYVPPLV